MQIISSNRPKVGVNLAGLDTPTRDALTATLRIIQELKDALISTINSNAVALNSLPIYANNAAAVVGGLAVGAFYRTGGDPDPVCVVH